MPNIRTRPPGTQVPIQVLDQIREHTIAIITSTVPLKPAGTSLVACCPFHTENTPSFSVHRERRTFHCFGCNTGGDVFDFLMKSENVTFPKAIQIAAQLAGVGIISERPSPQAKRDALAAEGLRRWRATELRRIGEELRERDFLIQIASETARRVTDRDDSAVWAMLTEAYNGYSELQWQWARLFDEKEFPSLELWRESTREAA